MPGDRYGLAAPSRSGTDISALFRGPFHQPQDVVGHHAPETDVVYLSPDSLGIIAFGVNCPASFR